jgi:hypothetical protein
VTYRTMCFTFLLWLAGPRQALSAQVPCYQERRMSATAFSAAHIALLAGEFDITTVDMTTKPWKYRTRRVQLLASDSLSEHIAQKDEPALLVGHVTAQADDSSSETRQASPWRGPVIYWTRGSLHIASDQPSAGGMLSPGPGDRLSVAWYTDKEFGGTWTFELAPRIRGFFDPAGYFCARRVDQQQ